MSRNESTASGLVSHLSTSERSKVKFSQLLDLCSEWDSHKVDIKEAHDSLCLGETRKTSIESEGENDYWDSKWTITNSVGKF